MKPDISNITNKVKDVTDKYGSEILTGLGVAGMISTVILAVKETPKALTILQKEERSRQGNSDESSTTTIEDISSAFPIKDRVRLTWKCYIPSTITGVTSIACLIGASKISAKRNAIIATAYTLSEKAFSEYRDKVVETIGEKKEQIIKDKVAEERIKRNPIANSEVTITNKGDTLCFDYMSGRYFRSSIENVKKAVNELNHRLMNETYVSLNEFYYEIDLKPTRLGDELGWNIDDGLIDLDTSSMLAEDGTPCLVIDYRIAPRYDYAHLM